MCLLLLSFIISKRMFVQMFGLLLYFTLKVELFPVFYIFQKSVTFSHKNLYSLLLDILKKMNSGSSGFSSAQIDLQNLKIC